MNYGLPADALEDIDDAGGDVFAVGGVVRDELMGVEPKDVDILVTGLPIDTLKTILQNYGKIDEVGKSFGVLKWDVPGLSEPVDVALPRTEISTGSGHKDFTVSFDHRLSVYDDLKRRDFTINAIAKNLLSGELVDPFGGVEDIKMQVLRCVSPISFKEDPLRILRGIQFASRFDLHVSCIHDMNRYGHHLTHISSERIAGELWKWLAKSPDPKGINWMCYANIWNKIFPYDIDNDRYDFNANDAVRRMPKDPDIRMASILCYSSLYLRISRLDAARKVCDDLKLASAGFNTESIMQWVEAFVDLDLADLNKLDLVFIRKAIAFAFKGDIKKFKDFTNILSFQDKGLAKSLVGLADQIENNNDPLSLRALVLNGNDLAELGFKGKKIGEALKHLLFFVLENPECNVVSVLKQEALTLI